MLNSNNIINRFVNILKKLRPNFSRKVIIAFSGGPDSVFLLNMLLKANISVELAYVNHNLREDSLDEENFVINISKKHNLKLYSINLDILNISKNLKLGIEETARIERYRFFGSLKGTVATAHNLDDNVETFIFRLIRGSSFNGLKGIPSIRGKYIRPILSFTKKEILSYLEDNKISYYIDSSNNENLYSRNKIRNQIFPVFEEINPMFRHKIDNLIADINKLFEIDHETSIPIKELLKTDNISRKKIDMIRKAVDKRGNHGSFRLNISKDRDLVTSYGKISISKGSSFKEDIKIERSFFKIGDSITFLNYIIFSEIIDLSQKNMLKFDFSDPTMCYFDISNDTDIDLNISSKDPGEKMSIFNMKGRKSLKKLFIDLKIDRFIRNRIPVIRYKNEVLWVPNLCRSNLWPIKPESKKILKLSFILR
jgi:tRNA(Ile)-lysidine synthase